MAYKKRGLFDAISKESSSSRKFLCTANSRQRLQGSDLQVASKNPKVSEFLKLTQLTKKDLESLRKIDGIMDEHAETIANRHYDMIMEIPEIKNIFVQYSVKERYTKAI